MFNPHPPLSAFPFVLTLLLLGSEIWALRSEDKFPKQLSKFFLFLLCFMAPLTYFSGSLGEPFAKGSHIPPEGVIAHHRLMARLFLLCLAPCILLGLLRFSAEYGKKVIRICYYFFLILTFGLISYTSFRGGELVFSYGAGVNLSNEKN